MLLTRNKSSKKHKVSKSNSSNKLSYLQKINPLSRVNKWREDRVNGKLKLAFEHLHNEFNQREQQLERRIQEIQQQHEVLLLQRKKKLRWIVPLGITATIASAYMLFVLTNMQNSMSQMTTSISGMNTYIASMSSDMNNMNNSMATMNNNVENMTTAIEPMGEAAQETTPFIRTFRSFMPF